MLCRSDRQERLPDWSTQVQQGGVRAHDAHRCIRADPLRPGVGFPERVLGAPPRADRPGRLVDAGATAARGPWARRPLGLLRARAAPREHRALEADGSGRPPAAVLPDAGRDADPSSNRRTPGPRLASGRRGPVPGSAGACVPRGRRPAVAPASGADGRAHRGGAAGAPEPPGAGLSGAAAPCRYRGARGGGGGARHHRPSGTRVAADRLQHLRALRPRGERAGARVGLPAGAVRRDGGAGAGPGAGGVRGPAVASA